MTFDELLKSKGISVWSDGKYCRQGWIQFHCPFCSGGSDPNKPYAGWNISSGYVHCWRCGPHNTAKTIALLTNSSWRAAKELAAEVSENCIFEKETEHQGTFKEPYGVGPLLACHKKYLRGRGFDPNELKALWRIRGIGLASKLAWRIWIPAIYRGKAVSWTTRSLVNSGIRYISAPPEKESIPIKSLLYGEDYTGQAISIHEGPFDVWRVGPGAVATLGTGFSNAQILKMAKYPRRIVCFDSEPAAQKRAKSLCHQLASFPGETFNLILSTKDAAEQEPDSRELKELRKMLR